MAKSSTGSKPYQGVGGFGASTLPPNRSNAIVEGAPLPLMHSDSLTRCVPFTLTTKNPLHYNDGPGTDEVVTSRRTSPPIETLLGHPDHQDLLEHSFGPDHNKYSAGPDDEYTLNGVCIRGT